MSRATSQVFLASLMLAATSRPALADEGQRSPAGVGSVIGRVVETHTGRPIAGAVVTIERTAGGMSTDPQTTSASGEFRFLGLQTPAVYLLRAMKPGFYQPAGVFDAYLATGRRVELAATTADTVLELIPESSIGGHVSDDNGTPLPGMKVVAAPFVSVSGRKILAGGTMTTTDERGNYLIRGLQQGGYAVIALPQPTGRSATSWPVLAYPANRPTEGVEVMLGIGEARAAVDVVIGPRPARAIRGTLVGAVTDGEQVELRLVAKGLEHLSGPVQTARLIANAGGTFEFESVAPGDYWIVADSLRVGIEVFPDPRVPVSMANLGIRYGRRPPPSLRSRASSPHYGRTPVSVRGDDLAGVEVEIDYRTVVRARVTYDGHPEVTFPDWGVLTLEPDDSDLARGAAAAPLGTGDGPAESLTLAGIGTGDFVFRAATPDGLAVKSVSQGGRVLADGVLSVPQEGVSDVVVTLTADVPILSGTVRRPPEGWDEDIAIVVFDAMDLAPHRVGDPQPVELRQVLRDATFRLRNLSAGDYLVFAVPERNATFWRAPDGLARAAGLAQRVSLRWGQEEKLQLDVIR
jgi:hypothetical protein